jgi:hypothetical protein
VCGRPPALSTPEHPARRSFAQGVSEAPDSLAELRAEWLAWMRERLPAAARSRPDWPIRLDHCFGRVILDAVYGRPWREAVRAPAWRHMDEAALRRAVALARDIAEGRADLPALNAASLLARGKRVSGGIGRR